MLLSIWVVPSPKALSHFHQLFRTTLFSFLHLWRRRHIPFCLSAMPLVGVEPPPTTRSCTACSRLTPWTYGPRRLLQVVACFLFSVVAGPLPPVALLAGNLADLFPRRPLLAAAIALGMVPCPGPYASGGGLGLHRGPQKLRGVIIHCVSACALLCSVMFVCTLVLCFFACFCFVFGVLRRTVALLRSFLIQPWPCLLTFFVKEYWQFFALRIFMAFTGLSRGLPPVLLSITKFLKDGSGLACLQNHNERITPRSRLISCAN